MPQKDPVRDAAGSRPPAIAEARDHGRHPIQPQIFQKVSEGHRVQLACINRLWAGTDRDGQREVADSREEIRDDRAGRDPPRDRCPFRKVPR